MPHRFLIRRAKRFFIYRVLHVDDTPHRIAMGVAIGIFVTWTPTIGLQMMLTVALAWLFRANKLVGLPFVWISNPLTVSLIYGPNYYLGKTILGTNAPAPDFMRALQCDGTLVERVQAWWAETYKVLTPLWLGSILVALLLGVIAYFATKYAVIEYRKILHHHQEKVALRKLKKCSSE